MPTSRWLRPQLRPIIRFTLLAGAGLLHLALTVIVMYFGARRYFQWNPFWVNGATAIGATVVFFVVIRRTASQNAGTLVWGRLGEFPYFQLIDTGLLPRANITDTTPVGSMVLLLVLRMLVLPAGLLLGGLIAPRYTHQIVLGWAAGGFITIGIESAALWFFATPVSRVDHVLRGTTLLDSQTALGFARTLPPDPNGSIYWGSIHLPERYSEGHFCAVGATGSGKTVTLRLLMQSVIPRIIPGSDWRALVYDAKRDMLSLLSGMKLGCEVVILNPFDVRSSAWNMADDITDPATALQIASIFIPEEHSHNRYFTDAARDILTGVLKAFIIHSPRVWTLRDILFVIRSEDRLRNLLESTTETRDVLDQHFKEERTLASVKSTLASRMSVFEPIAALWSRTANTFSLAQWRRQESILVLGSDETIRAPLDAINRLLIERLTELLLSDSESATRRTWIFFDEAKEAGKLETLPRLLSKGRSKGARVAIGFQDIEGLRHVYGDHSANELVGMCANKAILRVDSEPTARWGSQTISDGQIRRFTRSEGFTSGPQGGSSTTTVTEHILKEETVFSSEIMRLPLPDKALGVFHGYYITPAIGVYTAACRFKTNLWNPGTGENFIPGETQHQYLRAWDDEDHRRLGLAAPTAQTAQLPFPPTGSPLDAIPRMTPTTDI
ncbi:MAG: type IV secretion system DNA-binding domain-containing protein [Planctomycetes bacterium]|nr:type IV secretion system DNA-binding domain-containing protein [Planctomycetota bacterium]